MRMKPILFSAEFDKWLKKMKKKDKLNSKQVEKKLMNKYNKKGFVLDIFTVIIVAFLFFMFLGVFLYGFNEVYTNIRDSGVTMVGGGNLTQATEDTFGQANTGLTVWYWALGIIIFGLFLSILITNFLVKANPVFFIVYIIVIIFAIIFSVVISNAFETAIVDNAVIGDTIDNFAIPKLIFLNLPIWVTIFGFLGAVFLFINISRDEELGGGL